MDKVFKKQNEINVEVFVDDMVVKTSTWISHIKDLEETFDTSRNFLLKLNPTNLLLEYIQENFRVYDD